MDKAIAGVAVGLSMTLAVIMLAWVTVLPTIGLLWSIGWLR